MMDLKRKNPLKSKLSNRNYYSQSDGNFMNTVMSLNAHKYLDRIAWVRNWVHRLSSKSHIDIGCKDGYLPLLLQAEGVESIGIDPAEDAIDIAKVKALECDLDCSYLVGFYEEIPTGIQSNTVSCLEVIEHVIDPADLIKKMLSIGKYAFISTPDINGRHGLVDAERNQEHLRIFSKDELQELISKYAKIIECVIRDEQICILFTHK